MKATIGARIDRLDPNAKRALSAAAVIGSRFSRAYSKRWAFDPNVDDLVAGELIDQIRFTRQPEYVFHHPLIHTVAFESQLKSDRAELHRRVAPAIEPREPESADRKGAVIARFRGRHLSALGHLLVQALALCQAASIVRLAPVALDGTRVRADVLAEEVSALLAEAEWIDKAEDATWGRNSRGCRLPKHLRRSETRLAQTRGARAAFQAEAERRARERAALRPTAATTRMTPPPARAPREGHPGKEGAACPGRSAVVGVDRRGRLRRRGAQDRHVGRRRHTDNGVDHEVAGDRRGAGKQLHGR